MKSLPQNNNPNKKPTKQLPNTLGEVASRYGFSLRTLNDMIDNYPDLQEMVKPYRAGNKVIYPPIIIEKIYEKIGKP